MLIQILIATPLTCMSVTAVMGGLCLLKNQQLSRGLVKYIRQIERQIYKMSKAAASVYYTYMTYIRTTHNAPIILLCCLCTQRANVGSLLINYKTIRREYVYYSIISKVRLIPYIFTFLSKLNFKFIFFISKYRDLTPNIQLFINT